MRPTLTFLRSAVLALTCALPVAAPAVLMAPTAATAQTKLPAPYVSHALDALLLPIDDSVRATFGLAAADTGVFILATAPGGLAEDAGLLPGDVISFVRSEEILSPADLDEIVWNWIQQGIFDFIFDGTRAGAALATETVITLEIWESWVEITEVSSWSSYSYEGFSYEEYSVEYSEEITESYEESTYSESVEEESVEEEVTDEATEEEATDEATDEAGDEATDEGGDEDTGDDMADDTAEEDAGDEGGDEGGDDVEE